MRAEVLTSKPKSNSTLKPLFIQKNKLKCF